MIDHFDGGGGSYLEEYAKKYFEERRKYQQAREDIWRRMAPGVYEIPKDLGVGDPRPGEAVYVATPSAVYNENLKRWQTDQEIREIIGLTKKPDEETMAQYYENEFGYYEVPMGSFEKPRGNGLARGLVFMTGDGENKQWAKFFSLGLDFKFMETEYHIVWVGTGTHHANLYTVGLPDNKYIGTEIELYQSSKEGQVPTIEGLVDYISKKYPTRQPQKAEWLVANEDLGEKIIRGVVPGENYRNPKVVAKMLAEKSKSQREADKRRRKAEGKKEKSRGVSFMKALGTFVSTVLAGLLVYAILNWNTPKFKLELADQGVNRTYSHSVSFLNDSIGTEFKKIDGIPGVVVRTDLGWTLFDSEDEYEEIAKMMKKNPGRFSVKYDKLSRKLGVKSILAKQIGENEWPDDVKTLYIIRVITFYENEDKGKNFASRTEYRLNLAKRFRELENLHLDDLQDRVPIWQGGPNPVWGEIRQHGKS